MSGRDMCEAAMRGQAIGHTLTASGRSRTITDDRSLIFDAMPTAPAALATPARRGPKPKPNTRDNLIKVGVEMLHASGYTASGIKDIVAAADVPKGSFYTYFASKEDFGKAVIDFYFEAGIETLRQRLTNPAVPPLERMRAYFVERTNSFRDLGYARGCMLGNFSLEVADQSPEIRERLCAHFKTWGELLELCIAEAQRAGAVPSTMSADLLAQFLLNSWEGALLRMRAEKSDLPLKQFNEVIFDHLLGVQDIGQQVG